MNDVGVNNFLAPIGLGKYAQNFMNNGYDVESDFSYLRSLDLDLMGIQGQEDRTKILQAATSYENSLQYELYQWLKQSSLDHYFTYFISYGITTLHDLSKLELTPGCLRDLEIILPGHQARLKNALPALRKKPKLAEAEATVPEAVGYWGKPKALDGAICDFLCIRATLRSIKSHDPQFNEEFMVDSGSDVVTARQELLDQLDVELIGTIQSRGVHSTVEKQLFKAMLVIGNECVECEIMAEPYESIGNRVMRRFRHLIDCSVHYWLPANRIAPSSSSGNSGGNSGSNDTPETDEEDRGNGDAQGGQEGPSHQSGLSEQPGSSDPSVGPVGQPKPRGQPGSSSQLKPTDQPTPSGQPGSSSHPTPSRSRVTNRRGPGGQVEEKVRTGRGNQPGPNNSVEMKTASAKRTAEAPPSRDEAGPSTSP